MADAGGGDDADAEKGGMDMGEDESTAQRCFFACLDCLAATIRFLVAVWNGVRYVARHISYPIKQTVIRCTDGCRRWYRPYLAKKAQDSNAVPSFGYGQSRVPDFKY
mmetsp:Transcript_31984/g.74194  ORF Transcript_31984/g.74194 Transcript_31984/m.74194 type:complete len:107 (+) Transcript_31984:147-467(+)